MPLALARRYRPRRFSDLLVQDHVAAVLRGAVSSGHVGHGYLLTGPRGVGKTTAARILAMALNCPNRDAAGEPCGECGNCRRIWSGSANLDVVEIDAASNRGVDDARDLRERAMYAASEPGRHKVYIVDEAHMLTREAWNALLKVLEEPPPGVVFVFATTEPQKIAATAAPVMSRLQQFTFRRIGPAAIRARLADVLATEGIRYEEDALTLIARHADGGMRDALSMLDQCLSFGDGTLAVARVRETLGLVDDERYAELLRMVVERDAAAVFRLVESLLDAGADLSEFLSGAGEMLRALMMLQVGAEPDDLTEALRAVLERYRDTLAPGDILRMLRLLAADEATIRRSASPRMAVETLLLRWTLMDRLVTVEEVLRGRGTAPAATEGGRPAAGGRTEARRIAPSVAATAAPARPLRDAAPRSAPAARSDDAEEPAAPAVAAVPPTTLAFDAEALRTAWPDLLERARAEGSMVKLALQACRLAALEAPDTLVLALDDPDPGHRIMVEHQRERIARVLGAAVGRPVQLRIETPILSDEPDLEAARLTPTRIKGERLKEYRSLDPALDAAAAELDLEIIE